MRKSSINLKKATTFALLHNTRESLVKYTISDAKRNEYDLDAKQANEYYNGLFKDASSNYSKRTNQQIQVAEDKYIWEAVVNLEEFHQLKDLQDLAQTLEDIYGWRAIQLALHRDEGHVDKKTGEKIYNNHGHMVLMMLNKEGIYCFKKRDFGIKSMQQLQTIVANVLGMKRGTSKRKTKRVRLEHNEYRAVEQMKEEMTIKMDFLSMQIFNLRTNKKKTANTLRKKSKSEKVDEKSVLLDKRQSKNEVIKLHSLIRNNNLFMETLLKMFNKSFIKQDNCEFSLEEIIIKEIQNIQDNIESLTTENLELGNMDYTGEIIDEFSGDYSEFSIAYKELYDDQTNYKKLYEEECVKSLELHDLYATECNVNSYLEHQIKKSKKTPKEETIHKNNSPK